MADGNLNNLFTFGMVGTASTLALFLSFYPIRPYASLPSVLGNESLRIGVFLSTDVITTGRNNEGLLVDFMGEHCGIGIDVIRSSRHTELLEVPVTRYGAGLISMTTCEVTETIALIADVSSIQNVVLTYHGCSVPKIQNSTVYYLTTKPTYILSAIVHLIQRLEWTVVNVIYDDSIGNNLQPLQQLYTQLSGMHIIFAPVFLPNNISWTISWEEKDTIMEEITGNIKFDVRRRSYTRNVLVMLGFENLEWLLDQALNRGLLFGPIYMWLVLGLDLPLGCLDLKPLMNSNILFLTNEDMTCDFPFKAYRILALTVYVSMTLIVLFNLEDANSLVLAAMLVSELSFPGILNVTSLPSSSCGISDVHPFSSIKDKALWIADHKTTFFDEEGFQTDVVLQAWGPPIPEYTHNDTNFSLKANWSIEAGLVILEKDLFINSRYDFRGRLIKIAVWEARPFIIKRFRDDGTFYFKGLCITMLEEISKVLNFRYQIVEPEDEMYGKFDNETKKWMGMIGMVHRKEITMAVGPFTVSEQRASVVEFSSPFMEDQGGFVVRRVKDNGYTVFKIFRPFAWEVWGILLGTMFGVGIFLFLVDHLANYMKESPELRLYGLRTVIDYVWIVYGDLLDQSTDFSPRSSSGRVLIVVWWLFTIVIASMYTANLAAVLTVYIPPQHMETLEDLVKHPEVQPMVQPGSFLGDMFKESKPGSILSEVSHRLDQFNQPTDSSRALDLVRHSDGYAFLSDRSQLQYDVTHDCQQLALARERFGPPSKFAFPVVQHAPFIPALNQIIIRFQESGLMDRWYTEWWTQDCDLTDASSTPASVAMKELMGAFCLMAFISILAFIALFFEIILHIIYNDRFS